MIAWPQSVLADMAIVPGVSPASDVERVVLAVMLAVIGVVLLGLLFVRRRQMSRISVGLSILGALLSFFIGCAVSVRPTPVPTETFDQYRARSRGMETRAPSASVGDTLSQPSQPKEK